MLLKLIRRNRRLAERRSPVYDKNRYAKALVYAFTAFWAAYLVFVGVSLSIAFREGISCLEGYDALNCGLAVFLFIDFLVRLTFPLPAQEIKPYLLLPIRKRKLINAFLVQIGLKPFNLFWLFFFVPFGIMSVMPLYGIAGVAGYAAGIWLLTVANAYWTVLARTLTRIHVAWILLPILVYGGTLCLELGTGWVSSLGMTAGEGMIRMKPSAYLAVVSAIAVLCFLNSRIQQAAIYRELARKEDNRTRRVRQYAWMDKFGETGEYMKLELKLILRNKTTSTNFKTLTAITVLFALMTFWMAAGDDFDSLSGTVHFYCVYCFCAYGVAILSRVMAYEGNYLDGLMARKGSLYNLLKGKYCLHCLLLLIPLCCILPSAVWGNLSAGYVFGQLFFTAGVTLPMLMQLALVNDKTAPLTSSVWGKGQWNTAYQSVTVFVALTLPLLLNKLLTPLLGETAGNAANIALGLAGVLSRPIWLKATCRRLMKKRYAMMENLRNTR